MPDGGHRLAQEAVGVLGMLLEHPTGRGARGPAEPRQRDQGGQGVTHRYLQFRKETAVAVNGSRPDTIPAIADTSRSPGSAVQPGGRKQ